MSLQVWLPLNGDLHNQGLHGESIFTANNVVINNNGKIGKCYSFNGTNSYLIADFTPGTIVPNEMSFCCWVKLNEIGKTQALFSSRQTVWSGLSFFILSSNKLRFDNGNNENNSTNRTTFNDYIFAANIWYHIAVVQTNTQKKLYINGTLQQSINKASANLGNNTAVKGIIGAASGSSDATGNWLDGYLNDVRIYNHALSDKEVEEISKGLVLHYKLDGGWNGEENICYDSSGYNNDGTIIGSLIAVTDSTRYNCAIHFSATNQKIKIDNLTTAGFGNSYSFAWWEKIDSVTPMHWGFANGIRLNGMYTGVLWNTGNGSKNPLYIPGTTTQVTAPSVDTWHHWVMTGDGTKCKVYQDGELWAEAKTYKGITGTTIYLNGWDESTNYSSNDASVSDFRIYATALTETQIKELYNTSATIDNLGNIHTREFDENSNLNITKTGLFQANEIKDGNYQIASILKDTNSIQGNNLYEY